MEQDMRVFQIEPIAVSRKPIVIVRRKICVLYFTKISEKLFVIAI